MRVSIKVQRKIGTYEAISYLLLLGVAMPLKYLYGLPLGVQVVGMAHGLLWILYVFLAIAGFVLKQWSVQTAIVLIIASLLPFGPFIADRRLMRAIEAKN
jgi:integral membrane protein